MNEAKPDRRRINYRRGQDTIQCDADATDIVRLKTVQQDG